MRPANVNILLPIASLLIILTLNACCITRAQDEFGIKYISPTDLKSASVEGNATLHLDVETAVSWGRSKVGQFSSDTLKMKCDLTQHGDKMIDVSKEVRRRNYRNAPGQLDSYFKSIAGLEHVFLVENVECIPMDADAPLIGEKVEIGSDRRIIQDNESRNLFIYVEGAHKYYPTRNLLVVKDNNRVVVCRIYFAPTQRQETLGRYFRFALYPFTIALDIITFPIQVVTVHSGGHGCYGPCLSCPDWTCGAGR